MADQDSKPVDSAKLPAKKKSRDLGEPEPKPSRKVALDEVLRSLQDLVANELNVDQPSQPAAVDAKPKTAAKEPDPALPAVEEITLSGPSVPDETAPAVPEAAPLPETPRPVKPPKPEQKKVPPGGLQQELPYLDVVSEAKPEAPQTDLSLLIEPETPTSELPGAGDALPTPPVVETPALVIADDGAPTIELDGLPETAEAPATPPESTSPPPSAEISASDIPVLQDIVELDEHDSAHATSAPLPPAADARKLAIQVAARLNVELRKAGKPVLSTEVIARLAHELEEALAKVAENMGK